MAEEFPSVPGADPGAVKLKDGGWLLAITGPPRDRRQRTGPGANFAPPPPPTRMTASDANGDGTIDAWELENATKLLRKLDRNGDGQLTSEELGPRPRELGRAPRDPPPRQPAQR